MVIRLDNRRFGLNQKETIEIETLTTKIRKKLLTRDASITIIIPKSLFDTVPLMTAKLRRMTQQPWLFDVSARLENGNLTIALESCDGKEGEK
jgi:hypothetical protein